VSGDSYNMWQSDKYDENKSESRVVLCSVQAKVWGGGVWGRKKKKLSHRVQSQSQASLCHACFQ